MKILIAPDSYKGSLSSVEAANIMEQAILTVYPQSKTIIKPMADGGEGSLHALAYNQKKEKILLTATGPLGTKIKTYYYLVNQDTAIIESAMFCGLTLVPKHLRHPKRTTTYGLGEAILHALNIKVKKIIVCIGGSATNDGGYGMLKALGVKFTHDEYNKMHIYGQDLFLIENVDFSNVDSRLKDVDILTVCDVDNALLGDNGATKVYGKQKGLSSQEIVLYDKQLEKYSLLIEENLNQNIAKHKFTGAAGGLGFAFKAIDAKLVPGASYIAQETRIEQEVKDATLILTGEGKTDEQTSFGKVPYHLAQLAKKYDKPIFLLSGSVINRENLRQHYSGIFSIINEPMTVEKSMGEAKRLLYEKTVDLAMLLKNLTRK